MSTPIDKPGRTIDTAASPAGASGQATLQNGDPHEPAAVPSLERLCLNCFQALNPADSAAGKCSACGFDELHTPRLPSALPARLLLREQYVIGRILGHGGFGITYLAWDVSLKMKLAIKEYFPTHLVSRLPDTRTVHAHAGDAVENFERGLTRFLDEARTLARFHDQRGIVSVLSFFAAHRTGYIVMSYIDGITFKEYLQQCGGTIPFDTALALLDPLLRALEAVHEAGILHRDISPDNIYVTHRGDVKLLDFGAARETAEGSTTLSVVYKPGFTPPEQYLSHGRQGPWTDVYALGATLYRAVVGITPPAALDRFRTDSLVPPSRYVPSLGARGDGVFARALALEEADRYQSVRELERALREVDGAFKAEAREQPAPKAGNAALASAQPATDELPTRNGPPSAEPRATSQPAEDPRSAANDRRRRGLLLGLMLVAVCTGAVFFRRPQAVEPALVGPWVEESNLNGAPLHSRWSFSAGGSFSLHRTLELRGDLVLNGDRWELHGEHGDGFRGNVHLETPGSMTLRGLPLTSEEVTLTRDPPPPLPLSSEFISLIGEWGGTFRAAEGEGTITCRISPTAQVDLVITVSANGDVSARNGHFEIQRSDGARADSGSYTIRRHLSGAPTIEMTGETLRGELNRENGPAFAP